MTAADAFVARRRELGLTQQDVRRKTGISVRTIQYFETQGVWPIPSNRALLEKAVNWPAGEIVRLQNGDAA